MGSHSTKRRAPRSAAAPDASENGAPACLRATRCWANWLLLVEGIALLVFAIALGAWCGVKLANVSVYAEVADWLVTLGYTLYGIGIAAAALVVVPGIIAIVVGLRSRPAGLAIVAAVFALLLVAAFLAVSLALELGATSTVLTYAAALALAPLVYLVAAVVVRRSYRRQLRAGAVADGQGDARDDAERDAAAAGAPEEPQV